MIGIASSSAASAPLGTPRVPEVKLATGRDYRHAGRAFESLLRGTGAKPIPASRRDQAHLAATKLVSQALISPVMKEMRAGSIAWGPFAAGSAEKTFGPMLDQHIADRIAASPRLPIASRIEQTLLRRGGTAAARRGASA